MTCPRALRYSILTLTLLAGCAGVPRPSVATFVNATLPNDEPIFGNYNVGIAADVVLIAHCYGRSPVETVKAGNKTYTWEADSFEVIFVEKGNWLDTTLSFLSYQPPSVDSRTGPAVRPWPYNMGTYYRFWLDTRSTPARIIGQQPLLLVEEPAARPAR